MSNIKFPDDTISEILTRLPAKSIHRFKCVSKKWLSIICNPHFISSYICRFPPSWFIVDRVITESNEFTLILTHPPKVTTFSISTPKILEFDEPPPPTIGNNDFPFLISSSNGLVLFAIDIKRDPYKEHKKNPSYFVPAFTQNRLVVVNPITKDFVLLPNPKRMLLQKGAIGFVTRFDEIGVLERFLVVEYQPLMGSKSANLITFSSKTRKWVEICSNYMLDRHFWRFEGSIEFDGHLCWIDLSCGIISWDDPFGDVEKENKAICRFIALPNECRKPFNAPNLENERLINVGRGFIQYMEVFNEGNSRLNVWRLDYQCEEWSLVHNVSFLDVWVDENFLSYGLKKLILMPKIVHPFEEDIAFFETMEGYIISINFRAKKVESCGRRTKFNNFLFIMPSVLPSWPTSLPGEFKAAVAKELGNEYFQDNKFDEAIACYTRSIYLSPSAVCYANRATAYLKVRRFKEAEDDCTQSLNLDGKYFKAYGRRAIARKELDNLEGSLEDVASALELEPHNKAMKKQYDELKSLLKKEFGAKHDGGRGRGDSA